MEEKKPQNTAFWIHTLNRLSYETKESQIFIQIEPALIKSVQENSCQATISSEDVQRLVPAGIANSGEEKRFSN
jgi:hypothetical protein